jgi:hypothetical protein
MDDLEKFRYSQDEFGNVGSSKPKAKQKAKKVGAFIRGPIPMDWLAKASQIPRCNAVLVGLVLFHLAGMRSERTGLVLSVARCEPFGLGRRAVQRGLADLESNGLVRVDRVKGRCPRVDLVIE